MRALVCLLLALPVFAQQPPAYSLTPTRGTSDGGTQVTIHGNFKWLQFPYRVLFGSSEAELLGGSAQHLLVRTPAHLPSQVPITIYEAQVRINTGQGFTYEGDSIEFERILLPVFVNVEGAFGSVFRTDLTASRIAPQVELYGLQRSCQVTCIYPDPADVPFVLDAANPDLEPSEIEVTGSPGRFLYVRRGTANDVAMNLRAFDTSRAEENFGTEIPIVREDDFVVDQSRPVVLVGVPSDPRFRKTLRLYSTTEIGVIVTMTGTGVTRQQFVQLRPGTNIFEPAYAELSDFPENAGALRVTIDSGSPIITPPMPYDVWAFISVTNNETQHITTITPQP